MGQWLKVSTAVTLVMGPFIDATDGATPEIALDITEQEVLLSKNGGAFTLKHETTHGVHDAAHNGWYTIPLDTTDTNTLGRLDIAINMAGALPVWKSFMVVTADAWDSLFGAVVIGQAGAQAALVANNLDHLAKTATAAADMTTEVTDNTILARIIGNGDTSTFYPSTDGLHAAGVDLDAILADTTTIDTAGEITAAVWNADATSYQTAGTFGQAIGDPGADANTIFKAVVTDATGATVGVDVVAIKAETALIVADTETIDTAAEIAAAVWSADATSYQTLGTFGQAIGDPVADANTIYKAVVTDATGATVGVDVVAAKADTAAILLDTGTDGVVVAAGSKTGYALSATGADLILKTATFSLALADAVWDEATAGHVTASTEGKALVDILAASGTAAAYAIVNSGLGFRGTVTAVPGANQFTIGTLAGLGAGAFGDAVAPWYALVFRDAGGVAALPQGEFKKVTAYVTATGAFTTEAFTAAVDTGDDVIIINPRLADLASIRTSTDAILLDTGTDGVKIVADAITAATIAADAGNEIADAVLDRANAIETGLTLRQAERIIAAACAGKVSGAGTATVVIRNAVVDGTDRIVATVDANGNRTAIAYDLT